MQILSQNEYQLRKYLMKNRLYTPTGVIERRWRLQKAPMYEPLHQASGLHVTIKTAFLLALTTAKRCSDIYALAVDASHLRFNKSDGLVSLIVQIGSLAKSQLPSICPDPIVIPTLARTCNQRGHSDRLLCPIRALKCYLKMTKS